MIDLFKDTISKIKKEHENLKLEQCDEKFCDTIYPDTIEQNEKLSFINSNILQIILQRIICNCVLQIFVIYIFSDKIENNPNSKDAIDEAISSFTIGIYNIFSLIINNEFISTNNFSIESISDYNNLQLIISYSSDYYNEFYKNLQYQENIPKNYDSRQLFSKNFEYFIKSILETILEHYSETIEKENEIKKQELIDKKKIEIMGYIIELRNLGVYKQIDIENLTDEELFLSSFNLGNEIAEIKRKIEQEEQKKQKIEQEKQKIEQDKQEKKANEMANQLIKEADMEEEEQRIAKQHFLQQMLKLNKQKQNQKKIEEEEQIIAKQQEHENIVQSQKKQITTKKKINYIDLYYYESKKTERFHILVSNKNFNIDFTYYRFAELSLLIFKNISYLVTYLNNIGILKELNLNDKIINDNKELLIQSGNINEKVYSFELDPIISISSLVENIENQILVEKKIENQFLKYDYIIDGSNLFYRCNKNELKNLFNRFEEEQKVNFIITYKGKFEKERIENVLGKKQSFIYKNK